MLFVILLETIIAYWCTVLSQNIYFKGSHILTQSQINSTYKRRFQPLVPGISYVFSAYVDDRISNDQLVRVMGLAKNKGPKDKRGYPKSCMFRYQDGSKEIVPATIQNCNKNEDR